VNLPIVATGLALVLNGSFVLSAPLLQRAIHRRPSPDDRQQLRAVFAEEWEYELRQSPETGTALGSNSYNDRLDDYSAKAAQADVAERSKFVARVEAIDPSGLSQPDALSRELMIRNLKQAIEGAPFKSWEMPVKQMNGPHLSLVDKVTLMPLQQRA
jgi:uncharacterized protein (DUF885 family)